jgi:hypothetical protein
MSYVPESDWKQLRALKDDLLNVACEAIFQRIGQISAARKGREHEAYLELWQALKKEDDAIVAMFDDYTRSNAVFKIAALKYHGVLTDQQLAQFSPATQALVARLCEPNR